MAKSARGWDTGLQFQGNAVIGLGAILLHLIPTERVSQLDLKVSTVKKRRGGYLAHKMGLALRQTSCQEAEANGVSVDLLMPGPTVSQ